MALQEWVNSKFLLLLNTLFEVYNNILRNRNYISNNE